MLSFLFGIALFACGVLGPFLWQPAVGLAVYAVFTHVPPQQLGITALRAPLLVAVATLLAYLLSPRYPQKFNRFPAELLLYSVMLMGMFLGASNAFDSKLAFEHFTLYLKYGLYLLLLVNILDSLPRVQMFLNALLLGAAWMVYRCWDLRGTMAGRFENIDGGVVGDSNQFAAALIMMLPLVFVRMIGERPKYLKFGAALGIFGILMSVIITQSRGGFLGLMTFLVCLFVCFKNYRTKVVIFTLLAALLVAPFLTDHYLSRISTVTVSEEEARDASSESRLKFWGYAFELWQRHPLYGCGLRNFTYYNGYENEGKSWGEQGHVAHSLWFEALAEGGVLVFVPLVSMLALFFIRTNRVKKLFARQQEIYTDVVALQVGMLSFLVCATFVNRLVYEPIYWWCALAYVYERRIKPVEEERNQNDPSEQPSGQCSADYLQKKPPAAERC